MGWLRVFQLFGLILVNDAARILVVVPTPSISHHFVFRPLTEELARRGHHVTVITTDPAFLKGQGPENLTEIDVHDVAYSTFIKEIDGSIKYGTEDELYPQMEVYYKAFYRVLEEELKVEEVQDLIRNKNNQFDLLIFEAITRPTVIMTHIFKVPAIQMSSFGAMIGMFEIAGAPSHPLLYPTLFHQKLYNLTLWDRAVQLWKHMEHKNLVEFYENEENEMLKRLFGENTPSLSELWNNIDMFFLNVHPIWADNQPVPPNVVYLGGMNKNPIKELPQDLQSYMNSSKNGVIYMSLGTNVRLSQLPPEKVQVFMTVFSQLPYNVLLKWNVDEIPGKPQNIRIVKWVPQSDLLRHPNLKLFITQGGLQSTDEAINAGVPVIGLPLMADQWYNAEKYQKHKIGLKLAMGTLTEDELYNAIKVIIEDKSYRHNVLRLRAIMQDRPETSLERAVWWTEYVLRHGGAKHLRAPAANMHWTQYYEVELIATILMILITLGSAIFTAIIYFTRFVCTCKTTGGKIKKD